MLARRLRRGAAWALEYVEFTPGGYCTSIFVFSTQLKSQVASYYGVSGRNLLSSRALICWPLFSGSAWR